MALESQLIFIISQPRSGSTLTQKLLSNNDEVETVSEPWLLLPFLSIHRHDLIHASYNSKVASDGINDYLKKQNFEVEYKNKLRSFLLELYHVSPGKKYFIDKTPRYYEILEEIYNIFPKAKFLVLKRSPFASLYSMLQTWSGFKTDVNSLSTFYRDFLFAPQKIQNFLESHKDEKNIYEVKYEDIVKDSVLVVGQIYEWMNIPFTKEVLEIGKNEKVKGIYGDDVYKKSSADKVQADKNANWQEKISRDKSLERFYGEYYEYLGKEFLTDYGYGDVQLKIDKGIQFSKSNFKKLLDFSNNESEKYV